MSEAVLEGCLPFGSHLHMDKSLLEGNSFLSLSFYLFIFY
jgi:hypothetical protein